MKKKKKNHSKLSKNEPVKYPINQDKLFVKGFRRLKIDF